MPTIPLSLYIHTPWCIKKCPYCDFNSHVLHGALPEIDYLHALLKDLETHLEEIQDRPIISIFIGGGTPSLLSANFYEALFQQLQKKLIFVKNIEITLEANPGSIEQKKFLDFFQVGINRLSIGIQSLKDQHLQRLGRIHSAHEALTAVEVAKKAGFKNFNIDIMHGLPQQDCQEALEDLQQVLSLQPTHLSWYQLTIEPETFFFKHPPSLPSEDALWEIQTMGQQLLESAGFMQYEISAYSKENYQCQHNKNYWQYGDYLGIGAGAHSKMTNLNTREMIRYAKVKSPKEYMNANTPYVATKTNVTYDEIPLEFMMNYLRLRTSLSEDFFQQRTGLNFSDIEKPIKTAQNSGLIKVYDQEISVTPLGYRLLNELLELFVPGVA